jgi:hypothetical protein
MQGDYCARLIAVVLRRGVDFLLLSATSSALA